MDYFSPGLRELSRKFARQFNRLRMLAAHRKLSRAETELGLLGWQQAEYDADTQREVEKIQNYEREQSRLTNESAEHGRELRALNEQRDTQRKEYEEARRQVELLHREIVEPLEKYEKQLAVFRKQEPAYERRMPEIDRELREVNRRYTEMLNVNPQTPKIREELMRLRERTVSLPNEKAELRAQHLRAVSEIKSLETRIAQDRVRIAALESQIRELEESFAARDRELAAEIRNKEREKARIEKEIDQVEKAKANPYLQIGRVLADNNLAPMNQPNALEKVRRYRLAVQEIEYEVAKSMQATLQDDQTLIRTSYIVWASMAAALILIMAVLLRQ